MKTQKVNFGNTIIDAYPINGNNFRTIIKSLKLDDCSTEELIDAVESEIALLKLLYSDEGYKYVYISLERPDVLILFIKKPNIGDVISYSFDYDDYINQ